MYTIAGAFAGLAGAIDILGWQFRLSTGDVQASQIGFVGIAVALLGRNTAVGVGLAALLFGALVTGTSTRNRKDGMSSGPREADRSAVSVRRTQAPATRAAPGNPWNLIGGGPERTLLSGRFANGFPPSQSCISWFGGSPDGDPFRGRPRRRHRD